MLYYNSDVWHIPSNTHNSKKQLLSASALPLKLCTYSYDCNTSFLALHKQLKRATRHQIMLYKHSLLVHKTYSNESNSPEWLDLSLNQDFNNITEHTNFIDNRKIGKNILNNKFNFFNNKISYNSLNRSFLSYTILCK